MGGGEAGPASGKRLSDREPGLGGTPEWKGSRMTRSEVLRGSSRKPGIGIGRPHSELSPRL